MFGDWRGLDANLLLDLFDAVLHALQPFRRTTLKRSQLGRDVVRIAADLNRNLGKLDRDEIADADDEGDGGDHDYRSAKEVPDETFQPAGQWAEDHR